MVNYAKEVSDRIAKRDGTFGAKTKEKRAAKRKLEEEGGGGGDAAKMAKLDSGANTTLVNDPSSLLVGGQQSSGDPPSSEPRKIGGVSASNTPSSLLLGKELPTECNEMMLAMLFRQYSGYQEVKLLGEGYATIEFGSENEATSALKGLNGFKLTTSATLDLTYGER